MIDFTIVSVVKKNISAGELIIIKTIIYSLLFIHYYFIIVFTMILSVFYNRFQ